MGLALVGRFCSLGGFPSFCKPVSFKHPNHFRHFGAVGGKMVGAQESHLDHLLKLDPVVVAPEILVHEEFEILLTVNFLHLRWNRRKTPYRNISSVKCQDAEFIKSSVFYSPNQALLPSD